MPIIEVEWNFAAPFYFISFKTIFFLQVAGKTRKSYTYPHRKGAIGDMPSSGEFAIDTSLCV